MSYTRAMFHSAAVFNWAASLILFGPTGIAALLGIEPLPIGSVYEQIAVAAIALFGLGYWWAAGDPTRHRSLISLGMIGKLVVVSVVWIAVLRGQANWRCGGLASVDLIYAALFAKYLIENRERTPA